MLAVLLALALASECAAYTHLRVPHAKLFPAGLRPATRAAHSRMMRTWSAPARPNAESPVVAPTAFGADPTGKADSSNAFGLALAALGVRVYPFVVADSAYLSHSRSAGALRPAPYV